MRARSMTALLALGLVMVGVSGAAAQNAEIQGLLVGENGLALPNVAVTLEVDGEPQYQTFTNRNGFYRLTGIEPGSYTLRASRIGLSDEMRAVFLTAGDRQTVTLRLATAAVELDEIVVTPNQGAVARELGRQVVTSTDLAAVPVPGGAGDLATYLQILPGVTSTGDRGGQLFVRGGTPSSNLVLVDGIPVYKPFHILGFFSLFPEDLVSSADFYAGGFGARYSGRTSSVLDVRLRAGDPAAPRFRGSLSPFIAEGTAEGRFFGGGSWLVALRRSLVEETSEVLLGQKQPMTFDSQILKLSSSRTDDTWCSFLALRTHDQGLIDPENPSSRVSWGNLAGGMQCSGIWPTGEVVQVHVGFARSQNGAVTQGASDLSSTASRIYTDIHTTTPSLPVPLDVGIHGYIETFEYDLSELFGQQESQELNVVASAYAETLLPIGERIELRPGVVVGFNPQLGVEPRLRARWEPLGRSSEVVQASAGLHRQFTVGVSDFRDAGSVFTAWMSAEKPQKAFHGRLGWQQDLGTSVRWALEGYYNRMWDIPVPMWLAFVNFNTQLIQADGQAYGADLRIEYRTPTFYGYLGYGLGWTEYESSQVGFATWYGDAIQKYNPPHDRRHQLNAVATWDIGEFKFSSRWQFGSGLPFSQPVGFDDAFRFSTGLKDVRETLGTTRVVLDRPFGGRLPAVHRLDVSVERAFELSFGELTVQAGAVNTYDRRNMFYYDLYTGHRLDQLPLAPFASVTLETW